MSKRGYIFMIISFIMRLPLRERHHRAFREMPRESLLFALMMPPMRADDIASHSRRAHEGAYRAAADTTPATRRKRPLRQPTAYRQRDGGRYAFRRHPFSISIRFGLFFEAEVAFSLSGADDYHQCPVLTVAPFTILPTFCLGHFCQGVPQYIFSGDRGRRMIRLSPTRMRRRARTILMPPLMMQGGIDLRAMPRMGAFRRIHYQPRRCSGMKAIANAIGLFAGRYYRA